MSLQCGMRVRITKPGLLHGQEGTITSMSSPLLTVELDADESLVMVGIHEVQIIQPTQATGSDGVVQVQLPPDLPLQVCGQPVEAVVCIVRMPVTLRNWLQQRTGQQLTEAVVQAHDAAAAPVHPMAGFSPLPPWAQYQPVPPVPTLPQGAQLPTPGEIPRLHMARHLLEMFLHMRNNIALAASQPTPMVPGDEWKHGPVDAASLTLTPAETRLYNTCCDLLTTFMQPMVGCQKKPADAVDG